MELTAFIFLSSGLFLGWSLGANDASNVFGTAVGARMIRFGTAATLCSVFVLLGAVTSGAGAAHGLGELGAVNALAGAFTVAMAAALTVLSMTRLGLPVSTTQAIVGAIVGWNVFSGSVTDLSALGKIVSTWVAAPILGAAAAAFLYAATRGWVRRGRLHLLRLDHRTRVGLVVAGILGSYSLGANNIGNVMGVFLSSSPFASFEIGGLLTVTSTQQLFLLGGVAIGVGVFTYSRQVMMTVGRSILPLTPLGAFVSVISHSLVLFLFSSVTLQQFLLARGLPPIPLVPVSSSQAIVGAVIGIALVKGRNGLLRVRWGQVGGIALGWMATPALSGLVCFVSLFVMQNVFGQTVYVETRYEISARDVDRLVQLGISRPELVPLRGRRIASGEQFLYRLRQHTHLPRSQEKLVLETARVADIVIDPPTLATLDVGYLGTERASAVQALKGRRFDRRWTFEDALVKESEAWRALPAEPQNELANQRRAEELTYLYDLFENATTRLEERE